jgi:alpha-glucoside transport system substrate-binding protein
MAMMTGIGSTSAGCGGPTPPGTVTVLALWTGHEATEFRRVLTRFQERTGITVNYTGGREAPTALAQAVDKGNPPDVAVLSDPVAFQDYVTRHKVIPLDGVVDPQQLSGQYPDSWLRLMLAGSSRYYAVVVKASLKSLIWYDPQAFRALGYRPPRTWGDLNAFNQNAIRAGTPPWCMGLESTSDSGWPGTDWIEDILLHQSGPGTYQRWIDGTLPWTSAEVKQAWQTWGQIVATPGAIDGGGRSALITDYASAGAGLFRKSPGCLLDHQASFITAPYSATALEGGGLAQPGRDFDLFAFPQIDARYTNALEVGADLAGMFTDTPQARSLMAFLATSEAQQIWPGIPGSGALSVNTAVPLSVYGNPAAATMARMITGRTSSTSASPNPTTLSFDASDLMPASIRTAFYQAVLQYVANPGQLDDILTRLDQVRSHTNQ